MCTRPPHQVLALPRLAYLDLEANRIGLLGCFSLSELLLMPADAASSSSRVSNPLSRQRDHVHEASWLFM